MLGVLQAGCDVEAGVSLDGYYRGVRIKPDWRDELKVGDVLITPSGDLRIVRDVRMKKCGLLRCVTLAIRRCSWTRRAYTIYCRPDLVTIGYRKAGVRARLSGPLDEKMAQCLAYENRFNQCLTCHDAKAIA